MPPVTQSCQFLGFRTYNTTQIKQEPVIIIIIMQLSEESKVLHFATL